MLLWPQPQCFEDPIRDPSCVPLIHLRESQRGVPVVSCHISVIDILFGYEFPVGIENLDLPRILPNSNLEPLSFNLHVFVLLLELRGCLSKDGLFDEIRDFIPALCARCGIHSEADYVESTE